MVLPDEPRLKILMLEDEPADAELIEATLVRYGFELESVVVADREEFTNALQDLPDLIISDHGLPQFNALEAIKLARTRGFHGPVIVVTGQLTDSDAVGAMKAGAADYLLKDRLARLGPAVRAALDEHRLKLAQVEGAERERRQAERLNALNTVGLAITSSLDIHITLNVLLEQVLKILEVDAAAVLFLDEDARELSFADGRGFRTSLIEAPVLQVGQGLAGIAALERRLVSVGELPSNRSFVRRHLVAAEGFVGYHAVPLVAKGVTQGVLELFHRRAFTPDAEWRALVQALATPAAIAIENARLLEGMRKANSELHRAYDRALSGWAKTLELRDYETRGHSDRVVGISRAIGRAADFDGHLLAELKRGALLHDIGKIAVPDSILLKPGPLSDDERAVMQRHPDHGSQMLSGIPELAEATTVVYAHHERWDGRGYPRGLSGDRIPVLARAFSIADVYDALRSERRYKQAWPKEDVRRYIQEQSGTHFDPTFVQAFLRIPPAHLP